MRSETKCLRSFAELLCRDRSEEVVLENLHASVRYALSETGWALDLDEVGAAVVLFADQARPIDSGLAVAIIESYLAESTDRRIAARKVIEEAHIEHTSPAVKILMSLLVDRVDHLLLEGGSE